MAIKKDLSKVKDYFIKHDITLKGVSDMFSVNVETVRKRAYKEHWQELKADYKSQLMLNSEPTEPIKENITLTDLQELRTKNTYKLLILLNNSFNTVLPAEIIKVKSLTGALFDLNKIINDIRLEQDSDSDNIDKLDFYLNNLFSIDGLDTVLGEPVYKTDFSNNQEQEFTKFKENKAGNKL